MRIPPQEMSSKELRISRGIVIHVERKSILHSKRVFNMKLVIIKLIATYTSLGNISINKEQQVEG